MLKQRIKDFINGPLKDYADYDNRRMIPHLIDGLNMSQRKAIAAAIDMQSMVKVKVSSLAARAVEKFAYHHGEAIQGAIVGLAQDYAGKNNIPLLAPLGQFGNTMSDEHPAPRYIYTRLHDNFFDVFKKEDLSIVTQQYEDGEKIEPCFYIPTIPMVLVNGADGTGFGYKSFILQHNPDDLKKAILKLVKDENAQLHLTPWLKDWKGTISKNPLTKQVEYKGVLTVINKTTIHITEIPVCYDLKEYKEFLNKLVDTEVIKSYQNKSTDGNWLFEIICKRELVDNNAVDKLIQIFDLIQRETETVVCWLSNTKIKSFVSTEDLLREWVKNRLVFANISLKNQVTEYTEEVAWLKMRMTFVEWWLANTYEATKLTKSQLIEKVKSLTSGSSEQIDKIISIHIYQLTQDEIEKMRSQTLKAEKTLFKLSTKTAVEWYVELLA